jgi:hypothetical protein
MYNTNFIVKYYDIETELLHKLNTIMDDEDDEIYNRDDVLVICEKLYRDEFLSVFNLDKYEEEQLNNSIRELFELIKKSDQLMSVLDNMYLTKINMFKTNDDRIFSNYITLFSQQLFYISHRCICKYLKSGYIDDELLKELQKQIYLLVSE